KINVAAQLDATVQITVNHGLFLLLRHWPFIEISAFICSEALSVVGLHQAHAELVQPVSFAGLLGIEDRCPGDVQVRFVESHDQISSGQYSRIGFSTSSLFRSLAVPAIWGMKSTKRPSSGMWSFKFGCGQSVPHRTRSGKVSTMRR